MFCNSQLNDKYELKIRYDYANKLLIYQFQGDSNEDIPYRIVRYV